MMNIHGLEASSSSQPADYTQTVDIVEFRLRSNNSRETSSSNSNSSSGCSRHPSLLETYIIRAQSELHCLLWLVSRPHGDWQFLFNCFILIFS